MNINYIKQSASVILFVFIITLNYSCKKFLDAKPTSNISKISVSDLQGLLDDYDTMNTNYPCDGEISSDNYFLLDANFNTLSVPDEQNLYLWKTDAQRTAPGSVVGYWSNPYKIVYNANLILETLNTPEAGTLDQQTFNNLKGSALFYRAYVYFQLAQLYTKPYNANTAGQDLGIPIRITTAVEDKYDRGTVQKTYERIIADYQDAIALLPATSTIKTRPNRAAAYAGLARTYLAMEDYVNAGKMADECLKLYSTLMDYNSPAISKTSLTPFSRFNSEVIFQTLTISSGPLTPSRAKVNTDLYNSYSTQDLRKQVFFKTATGGFRFTGNYEPVTISTFFNGLATDEVYLIRAESYARAGNTTLAMADLNTLLRFRYASPYTNMTAINADDALTKILQERRKELLFRSIRWSDLRRLNKDTRFQTTLSRTNNGTTYVLPPNDLRYVLLIPQGVINTTGYPQNPR
ncbi:hypothetical protein TH53_04575 [Pedobacter lusitanus]|uniref:SusD family protein n=1 Tax=Pedobacter lusitanus TaxID=1503925 RepID=A0A0D0GM38_9SPHI|nr:RagB/SusD family nutrient uptake outer membrane protein [Pedobacter lusitanus]KIO78292.1 hypothetical protein TH53_04575 [Pedobacter lusitanus]